MLYDVSGHFGATIFLISIEMQQVMENAALLTINLCISDSGDKYTITLPVDENEHLTLQRDVVIVCYKSADRCEFNKIHFCVSLEDFT